MSYWALSDVLGPLGHVLGLLNGAAKLLAVIPAAVRVPSLHAMTGMSGEISSDRSYSCRFIKSVCDIFLFEIKY